MKKILVVSIMALIFTLTVFAQTAPFVAAQGNGDHHTACHAYCSAGEEKSQTSKTFSNPWMQTPTWYLWSDSSKIT